MPGKTRKSTRLGRLWQIEMETFVCWVELVGYPGGKNRSIKIPLRFLATAHSLLAG